MPLPDNISGKLAFNGPFASKLQTTKTRKILALTTIIYGLVLGLVPAVFAWFILTPATAGVWFVLFCGASAVVAAMLERMLFISIQTALPIEGKPYDEWQQQHFISAQISARKFTYLAMACLGILGLVTTYLSATSYPIETVIPLYVWGCASLCFLAYEAHYLVLSWCLPSGTEATDD